MAEDIFGLGDGFNYPAAPSGQSSNFVSDLPEAVDMYDDAILWALGLADEHRGSDAWKLYTGYRFGEPNRGFGNEFTESESKKLNSASIKYDFSNGGETIDQAKIDAAVEFATIAQIDTSFMYGTGGGSNRFRKQEVEVLFQGVEDRHSFHNPHLADAIVDAVRTRIIDLVELDLPTMTEKERETAFETLHTWLNTACKNDRDNRQFKTPRQTTKGMIVRLYRLFDEHGFYMRNKDQYATYKPIQLHALELVGVQNSALSMEITETVNIDHRNAQKTLSANSGYFYARMSERLPEGQALQAKLADLNALHEALVVQIGARSEVETANRIQRTNEERTRALGALSKLAATVTPIVTE